MSILRQQQAYQNTTEVAAVLADLAAIAEIDQAAEAISQRLKQQSNQATGIGCSLGFIAVFLVPFGTALLGQWVIAIAVPLIVVAVFFGIRAWNAHTRWKFERQLDFPNYRYQLLQRFLPVLQQDMKANGNVGVNLDFSPPDLRQKFVTKKNHPRRPNWTIEFYEDPWLRLRGRLVDGSRFLLTVSQRHQIRSGRNVNGKLRTRPRFKGFDLRLDLSCPPELRPVLATLPAPAPAVKLPEAAQLKQIKVTDKGLSLKVRLSAAPFPGFVPDSVRPELAYRHPSVLSPAAITQANRNLEQALLENSLAMFLSLFQVVNLARLQGRESA